MDIDTTRGRLWAEDSAYSEYVPRIVTVAHRLAMSQQLDWAPKSSAFMLLVKRGCDAADRTLSDMRREAPAAWQSLPRSGRVSIAVKTATRAMAEHLRTQGLSR